MQKREPLYAGKAKSVFRTDDEDLLIIEFRNDTSAFDGKKLAQLDKKGLVNNKFNAFIMEKLQKEGIRTHFHSLLSETESIVKALKMIPLESVVRNYSAGSLCRRLGVDEGIELKPSTYELFLKNDNLGDPLVNDDLAQSFGWATATQLDAMKSTSFEVNEILKKLFLDVDILLVDFKLEFGLFKNELILGDEFSPDGCRLWDAHTREKFDKDRFRQDLGDVIESYELVAKRLGIDI